MGLTGSVEAIFISPVKRQLPAEVALARAIAGQGLAGDRYCDGTGTFSASEGLPTQLTLIEAEALEHLAATAGIKLQPGESRRNVVTRGVRLNDLVGKRFRIGDVLFEGVRLCPPCAHLAQLTHPGVLEGLKGIGGLRAAILTDGFIGRGSAVTEA